jgi:hypothetical protein
LSIFYYAGGNFLAYFRLKKTMSTHSHPSLRVMLEKAIRIIFVLTLLCNSSFAQDNEKTATEPLPLEELKGFTQLYYYSPGHETRAKTIAVFMENAGQYFQQELRFTPKAKLYILAPQHWKDVAAPPLRDVYGFPHNIDQGRLAGRFYSASMTEVWG